MKSAIVYKFVSYLLENAARSESSPTYITVSIFIEEINRFNTITVDFLTPAAAAIAEIIWLRLTKALDKAT